MMRNKIILLVSLLFFIIPEMAFPSHTDWIKKVVMLEKDVSLSSQIKEGNTIYKVCYNYDLKGSEITIPEHCVLLFDGGGIENGTINFTNTELSGYPQIDCKLKGSIPKADITWFGAIRDDKNTDVGAIINKVQAITPHIIIPSGVFYQTDEAIRIEGDKSIEWIGTIVCVSNKKQFDAVTISSGVVTLDFRGSLVCKSKAVNYSKGQQSSICGLVIENIKNSRLNLGNIKGFNTGVKVFGSGGGCSYNTFNIMSIRDCNTGILITQRDKNGKIGWANENTFIGGRFGVNSSWDIKNRETHAIEAKGIYQDDSYNKVNSLYFLRPCAEGSYVPFVFNNAEIISVVDCRTERGVVGAKLSGRTNRICLANSFGSSLKNLDLTELDQGQSRPLFRELSSDGMGHITSTLTFSEGNDIPKKANIVFGDSLNTADRLVSINLPNNQNGDRRYLYLKVTETHNGAIGKESDISFSQSMYYNKKFKKWVTGTDADCVQIVVGDNVKRIEIEFRNVSNPTLIHSKKSSIFC